MPTKRTRKKSPAAQAGVIRSLNDIRKGMGRKPVPTLNKGFADTGSPELNKTLGAVDGIPWGTILEVSGPNSQGKTALSLDLAATFQSKYGAMVIWLDGESSFEKERQDSKLPWPQKRGVLVDEDHLVLVEPYINEDTGELSSAEDLLEESEVLMLQYAAAGRRVVFVCDSVSALLPEEQGTKGIRQNMKTNIATAALMSNLLRRWAALFPVHGIIGIFINQLRTKPGIAFGNPEYTTGGGALPFYAHSRVSIRRSGKDRGRIRKNGRVIGILSVIANFKNKAGGIEDGKCGYKIYASGKSNVVPVDEEED